MDDFTHATQTQVLQNKTEVASAVKNFIAMVETQFHATIILIRLGNGTEFINSACLDFFFS